MLQNFCLFVKTAVTKCEYQEFLSSNFREWVNWKYFSHSKNKAFDVIIDKHSAVYISVLWTRNLHSSCLKRLTFFLITHLIFYVSKFFDINKLFGFNFRRDIILAKSEKKEQNKNVNIKKFVYSKAKKYIKIFFSGVLFFEHKIVSHFIGSLTFYSVIGVIFKVKLVEWESNINIFFRCFRFFSSADKYNIFEKKIREKYTYLSICLLSVIFEW